MILYNCKTDRSAASYGKEQFIITKFDDGLNVEASYLLTRIDCTCPSWPRKSHCKHIDMLEKFRWREAVNTEWFYNAEAGSWHQPFPTIEFGSTPFPSSPGTSLLTGPEAAEGVAPSLPSAVPSRRRPIR